MKCFAKKWIWILWAAWVAVGPLPGRAAPNVVLIFTDDQGYADVGCYGAEGFETPALDQLAAEGARFTDYYAASPVCTPSRGSLLTGRYATRCFVPEVLGPAAGQYLKGYPMGLPASEITLAELLKPAGYATACIGKWHLGHEPRYLPTRQGFDEFFGIPYSNDMPIDPQAPLAEDILLRRGVTVEGIRAGAYDRKLTNPSGDLQAPATEFYVPLMRGEEVVEFPVDQARLTQRYTDEAISFMKRHRDQPFFLYLAHTMPHVPLASTEPFQGQSEAGRYGDVIEELDAHVGRLLRAVEDLGLADNTLVIFTSDNGPWTGLGDCSGSAKPLKGAKFQTHEGGQRVPMIARWPGRIPPGQVLSTPVSALDWFPTLAAIAGRELPGDRVIDGDNLLPLLEGKSDPAFAERPFFYLRGWEIQAVRQGQWKVQEATAGHFYRQKKDPDHPGFLYDLEADPAEARDLSAEHPEVFSRLKTLISDMDREIGSGLRKQRLGGE